MTVDDRVTLLCGDCLEVLVQLPENSVDSVVTDPPYHLTSIVKRFGADGAKPAVSSIQRRFAKTGAALSLDPNGEPTPDQYGRLSRGFMGKRWDGGDIAFDPETWRLVLRVLKPGGHLISFGGSRGYHRMACAIEDAGFEIRDSLMWLYGSGFPKSHDVSKGIDRAAGAEREVIGLNPTYRKDQIDAPSFTLQLNSNLTAAATAEAMQWSGFGTALKPAFEPIILARKPLSESTVAANVLKWGTGALNIDGCRVGDEDRFNPSAGNQRDGVTSDVNILDGTDPDAPGRSCIGRWPANVIHDGSDEVVGAFPETASGGYPPEGGQRSHGSTYGKPNTRGEQLFTTSEGSAARFFYTAKADSDDRLGSKHPTVKPLDLMQYLVRLVTPPKGLVLDPFAGTGTTGEACIREGMRAILIEREAEYQADIRRRMSLAMSGPDERSREAIKAKLKGKPVDHGPLFGGTMTAPTVNTGT